MNEKGAEDRREVRLRSLLAELKDSGLRMTPQRMAIVRALVSHEGHPTAEELHQALLPAFPTMSLATVYKTIALLKRMHQVIELEFSSRDNRFDGLNPHPHPHLLCTRCGRVCDPALPDLAAILEDLAVSTGYAVESHRLDFYGICPECLSQKN